MQRSRARWLGGTAVAVVAVVAAAVVVVTNFDATYGPDTNTTARVAGGQRAVEVTLSDFDVTPGTLVVDRGAHVVLDVVNQGEETHDLAIDGGPTTRLLAPGDTQRLDLGMVTDGLSAVCAVGIHASLGMTLDVRVR